VTEGESHNLRCNKCGKEGCYCRHSFADLGAMLVESFNRNDPNVIATVPVGEAEVKPKRLLEHQP
jgi:hypothetical protein